MRFWLATILGTVIIAAAVTWLLLRSEGKLDDAIVVVDRPVTVANSPKMVFLNEKPVANVLEINGRTSQVGEPNSVEIAFRNDGMGALTIQLVRTNCGCGHLITVDDQPLEVNKTVVTKGPGESGVLKLQWTPKMNQLSEGPDLRLSANFFVNDPRPEFVNGLRVEIKTLVTMPRKEPR